MWEGACSRYRVSVAEMSTDTLHRGQAPSHILIRVSLLELSATEMLSLQVVLGVASRRKAQKLGAAVLN
ncbi:hypothetical protein QFZ45_001720 [Pseudomonas synxantha]|nr:hypothetical protein [Pseudomonas synxantha]